MTLSEAQTTYMCDSLAYGEQLSITSKHTEEIIMGLYCDPCEKEALKISNFT